MTIEDAFSLTNGDNIIYNGKKYKVLHVKECRSSHTNEVYARIKCSRNNEVIWLIHTMCEAEN